MIDIQQYSPLPPWGQGPGLGVEKLRDLGLRDICACISVENIFEGHRFEMVYNEIIKLSPEVSCLTCFLLFAQPLARYTMNQTNVLIKSPVYVINCNFCRVSGKKVSALFAGGIMDQISGL